MNQQYPFTALFGLSDITVSHRRGSNNDYAFSMTLVVKGVPVAMLTHSDGESSLAATEWQPYPIPGMSDDQALFLMTLVRNRFDDLVMAAAPPELVALESAPADLAIAGLADGFCDASAALVAYIEFNVKHGIIHAMAPVVAEA